MIQFTRVSLLLSFILISAYSYSQTVSNVRARQQGENVIITYDLDGARSGQKFRIQVFSSHDNFSNPLENTTGDVGEDQSGRKDMQITWEAKKELGFGSKSLTFEVRSTMTFNPMTITSPTSDVKVKAGKPLPIVWTGGLSNAQIGIELLKGSTTTQIGTTRNSSMYNWTVPKEQEKGTDYRVRIFDQSNKQASQVNSSIFSISAGGGGGSKGLLIGIGAAAAVGGTLFALGVFDGTEPTMPPDDTDMDLPGPPDPTGNLGGVAGRRQPIIVIPLGF